MAIANSLWHLPQGNVASRKSFRTVGIRNRYMEKLQNNPQFGPLRLRALKNDNTENDNKDPINEEEEQLNQEPLKMNNPSETKNSPEGEPLKVISGSPLPGIKAPLESVKIPKVDLDVIRNQVFSFDTFFPTEQEYYESGVIFRGNLRGEPGKSHGKISARLQEKFGDVYKLFLLLDPLENKPTAAVVRNLTLQPEPGVLPDWFVVGAFGLVTLSTILLRNSPDLLQDFIRTEVNSDLLLNALPGALITVSTLLVHEAGHYIAAKNLGAKVGLPYFIPSWQLGSFGGITKISSVLKNRSELIEIAAAGPLAGALFSLSIVLLGLLLPPAEGQGLVVNSSLFHDSFLVGGMAKVLLGESLTEGATLSINPVVLPAWSGLLINAINCIPIGEIDGGLIAQGLWGRKVWSRVTGVSVALLGLSGLFSDVALYWVVLVIFLQRGPIPPQADEISTPSTAHVLVGVSVLLLSLLVCFPFPFLFTTSVPSF